MLRIILLLVTLLTFKALATQAQVNVHGTVVNANGETQEGVNILISAIYSDSSVVYESVFTGSDGQYQATIQAPPLNSIGFVQISMVDCWGTLVTFYYTIVNESDDILADFVYCESIGFDSCAVFIIQEWVPGALNSLVAWTPLPDPGVEFLWSTGETTQNIYPQASGEYCVTATYPWGCAVTDCYDYVMDTLSLCFAYIVSDVNNDGTYNLTAIPYGAAPFTYAWSTGDVSESISNVGEGTYCVTITDATDCTFSTCVFIDNHAFCDVWISCDPAGALVAQGYGQPPLNYIWNTGEVGEVIYPSQPGEYCVTVTDANQCSAASCFYYGGGIDSCFVFISPVFPDSNSYALQAFGYTSALSYAFIWSTGETGEIIYPQDPLQQYCVTMTDSDGCVATGCFDPYYWCYAWIDINYMDTTAAVLSVFTDPIYNNGNPGGASYLWSNGSTDPVITVGESGLYCVTVTLSDECVTETCVYVDFESLQLQCAAWIIQYPDSSGQWHAEALAWGFGTFSYQWSTGDTNSVIQLEFPNQLVCVTATNNFGCVAEACIDTLYNPCIASIGIEYTSPDLAVLHAYAWNNPGQGEYIWNTGQTGPDLTVNQEGLYCVTVTGSGCISEACVEVLFWNQQDSCGAWITEQAQPFGILYTAESWGVGPFSYMWSNGGTDQTQLIDFGLHDLCVTVTDAIGCAAVACNYDPNHGDPTYDITGFVFADSLIVHGFVHAYAADPSGGLVYVDSARILQRWYQFKGLPAGLYVVRADIIPGTLGFGEYIPTYHWDAASWEDAEPIALPNWLPVTKDIFMLRVDTTNGPGVIGGIINDPHNLTAAEEVEERGQSGVPGVTILLKDVYGRALNYKVSLQDGSFKFTDLPYGTYRVAYDIPGIYSQDVWVTLTPDNPEKLQVTIVVTNTTVAVEEPAIMQIELYPNPASDEISFALPVEGAEFYISIIDMQGRLIKAGNVTGRDGIMQLDISRLHPGLYQIHLQGDRSAHYGRFVKQE